MASVVVRGLDESVKERLAAQARERDRSMEVEVRDILTPVPPRRRIAIALLQAARSASGVDDLPIPERSDGVRWTEFE